jgi:hypothetical protein
MHLKPPNLPVTCVDCAGALREIVLFGRGEVHPITGSAVDAAVIHYTDANAVRGAWLGLFQISGDVKSLMCSACGRIFLYGVAKPTKD